jgi:hypothetical protein
MLISHRWSSKIALFMALGITSTAAFPILVTAPATASFKPYVTAQIFSQSERVAIPAGTVIPVEYDEAEKIIVTPDETAPVTLTVAADIRSSSGTILIPRGSKIEGELQPAGGGTQFVAQELMIKNSNRRLSIDATSEVITETETLKQGTDTSGILKGAAIGAAAAAVISEIFGDIDLGEVLAGGGLGALAGLLLGNRNQTEVVVVYPEADLDLTLQSGLTLN